MRKPPKRKEVAHIWNRRTVVLIAAAVAIAIAFGAAVAQTPYQSLLSGVLDGINSDSPWGIIGTEATFDSWQAEAATFIDVRTPEEYEAGHIPGAINVPLETVPENVDKLPQDEDTFLIVYCKSGWRANIGMVTLRLLGYSNTKGYKDSWLGWTDAGHPVKEGSQP